MKIEEIWGVHKLSEEEMEEKRIHIGDAITERSRFEKRTKELQSDVKEMKERVTSADARIKRLSDCLRTGEEEKHIRCEVVLRPKSEEKDYISIETGEKIKTKKMSADDFQLIANLPIKEGDTKVVEFDEVKEEEE